MRPVSPELHARPAQPVGWSTAVWNILAILHADQQVLFPLACCPSSFPAPQSTPLVSPAPALTPLSRCSLPTAHLSDEVKRKFYKNYFKTKKKAFSKYAKKYEDGKGAIEAELEELKQHSTVIRVLVHTQIKKISNWGQKKAHMLEVQVGACLSSPTLSRLLLQAVPRSMCGCLSIAAVCFAAHCARRTKTIQEDRSSMPKP